MYFGEIKPGGVRLGVERQDREQKSANLRLRTEKRLAEEMPGGNGEAQQQYEKSNYVSDDFTATELYLV